MKWFCSTADVTLPPIALSRVLTPVFGTVCGGFVLMVFAGFLLDGAVAQRWPRLASSGHLNAETEEKLVRLPAGAFFLLLWDKGAVVLWERGDAILTPDGKRLVDGRAAMGNRRFDRLASHLHPWRGWNLHPLWLWNCAVWPFHMTNYVFFPGIAAYLVLTSIGSPGSLRLRVPLLAGGLAFDLMWTAIEKFVYPEWTLFVVAEHPDLAFGFPWLFVVVVAAFVGFTLAFYIMMDRGLVRFGAAAFAAIFIAGIPEFGHLRTVVHGSAARRG